MSELFNRGDTAYLLLNYTLNGEPLQQDVYQEIELQINKQGDLVSVKKLYTNGDIYWSDDFSYTDEQGQTQTFSGYVCLLSQEETFKLADGECEVQLRVMLNDEVGSSEYSSIDIGEALSRKVLG